ncbi:MAG: hypothetical protein KBE16_06200 [Alphaproteobacteria bacterium]|nr:hypothetical protein [Alphaproteobacteria bacterium]MBP9878167.1 hypothetical protein [Alphaproteobacteria bacterium]
MVFTINPKQASPQKNVSGKENVSVVLTDLKKRCSSDQENLQPSKKILTERHVLESQKTPVLPLSPAKLNSPRTPPKGTGSPLKPPTPTLHHQKTIPINLDELNGTVIISDKDIAKMEQKPEEEIDPNFDEFAKTIRLGPISDLGDVQSIFITDEELTYFPINWEKAQSLKSLNLSMNKITAIPDEIETLESIQSLTLCLNLLTTINSKLLNCNTLTTLDVSENRITDLPADIGRLEHLSFLEIQHNPITTLPDSITKLTHLHSLDCRGTLIQWDNLSESVQNWLKRKTMDPSKMNAYEDVFAPEPQMEVAGIDLPSDIDFVEGKLNTLKNPEYCNLSALNLVTLPESLGELEGLKVLNLADNFFLKQLPETMTRLTELDFLNLKGTAIQFESLSRQLQDWLLDLQDNGCTIVGIDIIDMNEA